MASKQKKKKPISALENAEQTVADVAKVAIVGGVGATLLGAVPKL